MLDDVESSTDALPTAIRTGEVGNAGQCSKCDQWVSAGPDSCIGRLPGVTAACCGHGYRTPYVAFGIAATDYDPSGVTTVALYGPSAVAYFDHVKAHPGEPFLIDAEAWTRYEPGLDTATQVHEMIHDHIKDVEQWVKLRDEPAESRVNWMEVAHRWHRLAILASTERPVSLDNPGWRYFGSAVCGVAVCNWSGPVADFPYHPHRT